MTTRRPKPAGSSDEPPPSEIRPPGNMPRGDPDRAGERLVSLIARLVSLISRIDGLLRRRLVRAGPIAGLHRRNDVLNPPRRRMPALLLARPGACRTRRRLVG